MTVTCQILTNLQNSFTTGKRTKQNQYNIYYLHRSVWQHLPAIHM